MVVKNICGHKMLAVWGSVFSEGIWRFLTNVQNMDSVGVLLDYQEITAAKLNSDVFCMWACN